MQKKRRNCCQFVGKKDSETDWQHILKIEDKLLLELIQREYTEKDIKNYM